MNVTINGKIVKELPQKSGIGRNGGEWISKDFVIETEDGSTIAFSVFGEGRIKNSGLAVGVWASVTCELVSKEWKDRWFTSISYLSSIVQTNKQPNTENSSINDAQSVQNSINKMMSNHKEEGSNVSASDLVF